MPYAIYNNEHTFNTDIPTDQLTTNGKTTGPSDYVKQKGLKDLDKPNDFDRDSQLGILRAKLTFLQDEINVFLTEKLSVANGQSINDELEKKVLDGDDDV